MTAPYYPVRDQRGELEYREMVDEAVKIAVRRKQKLPPKYHREIDGLLDRYAFHLARNFNQHFALLRFSNAGELIRKNVEEFFTIQSMLNAGNASAFCPSTGFTRSTKASTAAPVFPFRNGNSWKNPWMPANGNASHETGRSSLLDIGPT